MAADTITAGWVVGVLLQPPGEPRPLLHYFAAVFEDQGKAEWTAVDFAGREGRIASSPVAGQEPVQAIRPLTRDRMNRLGLASGELRSLGWRRPRPWLTG